MKKETNAEAMVQLLASYPRRISEYLLASILLSEDYPELSENLEELAVDEAARFRLLGSMLLRKGRDPAVRVLLRRGGRLSRGLDTADAETIERFLQGMTEQTEGLLREFQRMLTVPEWESEDEAEALLQGEEAELRRLRNMLS